MASIDFCPLAKWVGEWRKHGLVAGRGSPVLHEAQRRKDGDTPAITKRSAARAQTAWPLRQGAGTGPGASQTTRRHSRLRLRWSQGDDSP
jgi:hypothetical protein